MTLSTERVTVPDHVVMERLENQAVLLNLSNEIYFALDDVSTVIWEHITKAPSIHAAVDQLADHFEVERARLEQDVAAYIEELVQHGLLHRTDAGV